MFLKGDIGAPHVEKLIELHIGFSILTLSPT